jgi:hypothetical protein
LLDEWSKKNKRGIATKRASQIALYYLKELNKDKFQYRFKDSKKKVIEIILNGGIEIKEELENIFNEIISKKEKDDSNTYYDLVQTILSSALTSLEMAIILPEQVIKLAELFWYQSIEEKLEKKKERMEFGYSSYDRWEIEDYFCISTKHREYYPASAYQTPIFQLLRFAPMSTINFILSFTNKTVECFARSKYDDQIEQVDVYVSEDEIVKQYVNPMLWNTYRGNQNAPELLESIHMALEKYLLDYAKTASKENLENWCLYLIKKSISASITAIVGSVVLANPSKLFNVAKILFQTKEFFQYDTSRTVLEMGSKSYFSIGYGIPENEIFIDERVKTCDDAHRKGALEYLAVDYQFLKLEGDNDNDIKERQEKLWEIFDNYYSKLPDKSDQTHNDKVWRIYLARMDRRKMNPVYEKKDEGVLIRFNPELDSELREMGETSSKQLSESMKYMDLRWWAENRFRKDENGYKKYQKYENDIELVISEVKEILIELETKSEYGYSLYYGSTPAYACAVLLRDFFDTLDKRTKVFCKKIICNLAFRYIRSQKLPEGFHDIEKPVIATLPLILKNFPKDRDKIKMFLFLSLIESSGRNCREIGIKAIRNNLWKLSFEDAQSIFSGYLLLKPKYNELKNELRKRHYEKFEFSDISENEVLKQFLAENSSDLENVISNSVDFEDFENIRSLNLNSLLIAFELLPIETNDDKHKHFAEVISQVFSEKLFITDRENKVDYDIRSRFFTEFAYFVLSASKDEIEKYIKPFLDNFSISENTSEFFSSFVSAEDDLNKYENFWTIWNLFYDKIVKICRESNRNHYTKEILHKYLLSLWWKEDAKHWRSLKEREKLFFQKVAKDIGQYPPVLFSISKFLNEIGEIFLDEGIIWISDILQKNKNLVSEELENGTIIYLERLVRKYILTNRSKIKKTIQIKRRIVTILDFLVEKGSVTGYLLRENIL